MNSPGWRIRYIFLTLLLLLLVCGCGNNPVEVADPEPDQSKDLRAVTSDLLFEIKLQDGGAREAGPPTEIVMEEVVAPDDGMPGPDLLTHDLTDTTSGDSVDITLLKETWEAGDSSWELPHLDGSPSDLPSDSAPLFDHEMIQDAATANCTFSGHHTTLKDGVLVDVWHVTYTSWQVVGDTLDPILIQGYAARPTLASGGIPGIIKAHGLGGYAKESHATGTAALLGMFVLAYTGPGGGTEAANSSEGLPSTYDSGYRMFDVLTDLRGTWFWGHTMAAMRGLTCLANHPDVDADRLGVTGYSAGGVVSNLVSGVDPRVVAGVPLSGVLAWNVATESPHAWQHDLLNEAGLDISSPEWLKLMELVDPESVYGDDSAATMIANGSSDEFFPLTAHMATYNAISTTRRMSLSANFDHGCFLLTGGESPETIEARAELRAKGAQLLWFHHHFGSDDRFAYLPLSPTFTATPMGPATAVTALVDGSSPDLEVEEVKVWWSNDDAFLFGSVTLKEQGGGVYGELALFPTQGNSVLFVDVQYKTKEWIAPLRFSLSSMPQIPEGFVPHIRDVNSCL